MKQGNKVQHVGEAPIPRGDVAEAAAGSPPPVTCLRAIGARSANGTPVSGVTKNDRAGFTLVEVLVSAIIILLMIMGTTAAMRQGQKVAALDMQRNAVRQAMVGELEKPIYGHEGYELLTVPFSGNGPTVIIDDRGAEPDLTTVIHMEITQKDTTINSVAIPYKLIELSAKWESIDGKDSLNLEKWICKLLLP